VPPAAQLLIVKPQNDFCDVHCAALPVPGANADLQRLAAFVDRCGDRIGHIQVMLEFRHPLNISHACWWQDATGQPPAPFTVVTRDDVLHKRWYARDPALQALALAYVCALDQRGRYPLIVRPEHCLIGSWGGGIQPDLQGALNRWCHRTLRSVSYAPVGLNPHTEHYSALQAEVPNLADAFTMANDALLTSLAKAEHLIVAGESLSHGLAATVYDIAALLGPSAVRKITLLTDCTSSMAGFEEMGRLFLADLVGRGMRVANSTELQLV
jgi:nicotinamidase-related amidase